MFVRVAVAILLSYLHALIELHQGNGIVAKNVKTHFQLIKDMILGYQLYEINYFRYWVELNVCAITLLVFMAIVYVRYMM